MQGTGSFQGALEVKNSSVLVYNRINKSGSTSMTSMIMIINSDTEKQASYMVLAKLEKN